MALIARNVRNYLRSNENQFAVQKIPRNIQITSTDLAQLERAFTDAGFGTEAEITHVSEQSGGTGSFLCCLIGLERAAAASAFDAFQAQGTRPGASYGRSSRNRNAWSTACIWFSGRYPT